MNYSDGDSMSASQWISLPGSHAQDTGVVFTHSAITMADIEDGCSNTYLIGEKYVNPDCYTGPGDPADNQHWNIGVDWDTVRYTGTTTNAPGTTSFSNWSEYFMPRQDVPGYLLGFVFGGAHPNGVNISLCDGSVRRINYTIDPAIHWCLGNRLDGHAIDAKKL